MKGKQETTCFNRVLQPRYFALVAMLAVFLLIFPPNMLSQKEDFDLEASLEVKEMASLGESVNVKFTLYNTTDEPLIVLKWQTPLEGVIGEPFSVKRDGKEVSYFGILVKRGAPLPDEYVTIEPGAFVSSVVDLTNSYDFSQPGDYEIEFISPSVSHVVRKESAKARNLKKLGPVLMPSNIATISITDNGGDGSPNGPSVFSDEQKEPKYGAKKEIVYTGCSGSEETTLKDADTGASLNVSFVHAKLQGLSTSERQNYQLYKTWFGAYTAARYARVLDNYNEIKEAFLDKKITYNCSGTDCASNWYAYVYAGGEIEVFLCPQFWSAPDSGTDSKFGVLIHEVSHEVAGTDDHAYGETNCKNLAINDSGKAVDNADSHEYFSEHFKVDIGLPDFLMYSLILILFIFLAAGVQRYLKYRKSQA
jgi:peptidyl-Lys metalloendopeptidase